MASDDVGAVLKIIRNVDVTSGSVCLNRNQCKRLAGRLDGIGKALQGLKREDGGDLVLETSAVDQILTLVKKAEALVLSYGEERTALQSVLSGADNAEAFKEIHEELDVFGTYLDVDHVGHSELRRSPTETSKLLNVDAKTDLEEMPPKLHHLIREVSPQTNGRGVEQVEGDVKNMQMAVTDKLHDTGSHVQDLSYLNIPFSAIQTHGEIKALPPLSERPTQADAHLDGKAIVLKGTWNGCDCAIKVFKSAEMHWNKEERQKEVESLVRLRHPHVTHLLGCSENDDRGETYVLYEKMDSDLRALMQSRKKKKTWFSPNRPFSRAEEVSIITQIARGMFYLHKQKLTHGELKCSNLLVKEVGNHLDVKVADFHCSRQLGQQPSGTRKYKPAHRHRWLPPEAFQHWNVDQPADDVLMKGDVYSFAMTCCEVVTGKYPFDGISDKELLEKKIKAGDRPNLPGDLSMTLKNLISLCWDAEPAKRPSFESICYVLEVEAVDLQSSPFQTLLSCFSLAGSRTQPVADLEGQQWTDVLEDVATLPPPKQKEIDNGARDLPHYLKIPSTALKPVQKLGTGASAEVYEASWIGCKFAVKWLKVEHVVKLRHEVRIMMQLLHPHVIRLVGFSVLSNRCAIVMELMEMSLRKLVDDRIRSSKQKPAVPFSESEALGIITKLALGLSFSHARGVSHGDLKCDNVLVRNTNTTGRLDVKIVDFGLSQWVGLGSSGKPTVVGWWRAPEVIQSMEPGNHAIIDIDREAADVYSFAMMCYEVISGKLPFEEYKFQGAVAKAVVLGGGMPKLDDVHVRKELKHLLRKCWSLNPQDRPKMDDVVGKLTAMSRQ